jgi:hypothetical protein
MALTNRDRVGRALDLLKDGLHPFVERELKSAYKDKWMNAAKPSLPTWTQNPKPGKPGESNLNWDTQVLLSVMWDLWNDVFRNTLGPSERSIVSELREIRNKWAHQKTFSTFDALRALDHVRVLLTSIGSPEVRTVEQQYEELLRLKFEEQQRSETRKMATTTLEGKPVSDLPAWRDLVTPHKDVADGKYTNAEFAANLWQVYQNEAPPEYGNAEEFFRRTYLTKGLKFILGNALQRLNKQGGDPVIELQTQFGGGKTHSLLALYHLCSNTPVTLLPGMEDIAKSAAVSKPPVVRRAVLVGQYLSPAEGNRKSDGTIVRTLWGEIAWQLGGREGYELVRKADEKSVAPGESLREVLKRYAPCLILIDEWVAYVRLLYGKRDLPGGDFDAHFTFAQTLTESVEATPGALLVVSIPASDREVGGEGGREALARLKHVVGRLQTPWRPATQEESYEIVRRRLFEPLNADQARKRDAVVRRFREEYEKNKAEFPSGVELADYERRMRVAYPVHPEVFDRLYTDWSELEGFQRTRGVLRLMAAVIHDLWKCNDRGLVILPAHISIDASAIQDELVRYLPDNWRAVIEKDVDGAQSLPLRLDGENTIFGRYSACRRVARTVYLGSAPHGAAAHKGLDDRQIKLGCLQPGENSATFGDALRQLASQSTYLYVDQGRYWYSTQPSVAQLARERAERYELDDVFDVIRKRLQQAARRPCDFARVHPCPADSSQVVDEMDARLVILGPEFPHRAKATDSPAQIFCNETRKQRGTAPRQYSNSLIFLAPDEVRLADLVKAVREFKAWDSIYDERETLDLNAFQRKQAETKRKESDDAIEARILETYVWLLVPVQQTAEDAVTIDEARLQGAGTLVERASRKVVSEQHLYKDMGGTNLRLAMDTHPYLWREKNHVLLKQVIEDFARYNYLPRVRDAQVVVKALEQTTGNLAWKEEGLAYAEAFDEGKNRYRGLVAGIHGNIYESKTAVIVKPEVAAEQLEQEEYALQIRNSAKPADSTEKSSQLPISGSNGSVEKATATTIIALPPVRRRFHGSIKVKPMMLSTEIAKISEAVIQHLSSLIDAEVEVTLDIAAYIPNGAPEHVVRTVTENCRTLKFNPLPQFEEN